MPKVYTYNAEFNPISFTDRIAPMKLYKEEYDKQQAAYEKMLEETDDLGVLKDIAMDADSYGIYKSFQDELNSIADEMATKGLSTDIRNRLLKLKRRQANEINPLLERQKSRADLIKEQRKYLETHPNGMFDIDYDSVPLSKISSSSTYKPYDLGKDYVSIADTIYSNIMSNNGTDTTNYNEIKNQYNYENLSPSKQKQVDDIINLAKNKATATYQIYKDKEAMDLYRYGNKKTGSNSKVNKSYSDWHTMPDGISVKIERDASGRERIKSKDDNIREINPNYTENMTDEQKNIAYAKAVYRAYYNGYNYDGDISIPGAKVTVLSDDDGNKYIYNKKKELVPIGDESLQGITELYRGTGASWLSSSGSYKYQPSPGHKENDRQKASIGKLTQIKNYNDDIPNIVLNQIYKLLNAELGKEQETLKQAISDGTRIYYTPYTNNNGNAVGYEITIKPPEERRKQSSQQVVQQPSKSNIQPDNNKEEVKSVESIEE